MLSHGVGGVGGVGWWSAGRGAAGERKKEWSWQSIGDDIYNHTDPLTRLLGIRTVKVLQVEFDFWRYIVLKKISILSVIGICHV